MFRQTLWLAQTSLSPVLTDASVDASWYRYSLHFPARIRHSVEIARGKRIPGRRCWIILCRQKQKQYAPHVARAASRAVSHNPGIGQERLFLQRNCPARSTQPQGSLHLRKRVISDCSAASRRPSFLSRDLCFRVTDDVHHAYGRNVFQ